jgi:virulence factor
VTADLRVGIVGVNMGHAEDFARLINGFGGSGGLVPNAVVACVWGDDAGDGERVPVDSGQILARAPGSSGSEAHRLASEYHIARVVDDPREMVGQVDLALVVDDTGHGASHRALATPFLDAGIATFIDKPMVLAVADAIAVFDLAKSQATPVMSCSALRFAEDLPEIASMPRNELESLYAVSHGSWFYYGVHLAEMLSAIGAGRATSVRRTGTVNHDVALVEYSSGTIAVIELVRGTAVQSHRLEARARTRVRTIDISPASYEGLFRLQLRATAEMARTRTAFVAREDTLDIIEMLELGERSYLSGGLPAFAEESGRGERHRDPVTRPA